jgi:hypothetical protein
MPDIGTVTLGLEVRQGKSVVDVTNQLDRMERKLVKVAIAERNGTIAAGSLKKAQQQLRMELAKYTGSLGQANTALAQMTNRISMMEDAQLMAAGGMQAMGRSMNRAGVITQQAGYQLGDFIVQVQSGTNAFVAFGQQATQVAGTLTMLGGKWVMIGSALGIAIPLLTAMGAAFMRTRQDAEETVEPLDELAKSMKEFAEVDLSQLGRGFQAVSAEADILLGKLQEYRVQSLRTALEDSIADIFTQGDFGKIEAAIRSQFQAGGAGLTIGETGFAAAAGVSQEAVANYQEVQRIMSQISGDTAPELAQSLAEATAELERQGRLSPQLVEQINEMVDSLGLEGELLTDNTDKYEAIYAILEEERDLRKEIARHVGDQSRDLDNQVRLMELTLTYGEDSRQVEAERLRQARLAFLIEQMRKGVQDEQLANLMAQYDAYAQLNSIMNLPVYGPEIPSGFYGPDRESGRQIQSLDEIIQKRQEQIDLELELFGLSEQQANARRIQYEIENKYRGELNDEMRNQIVLAAEAMAADEERIRQLEELRDRNQAVADSIADNFGKALTSVVDGTKSVKDAFKDMARAIIADLYQMYVVKQITGFISGGINQAMGGGGGFLSSIFGGGRASGGTMSPNTPYLVGERGPELVMPSRQSTVMNADLTAKTLGGGESVNVTQVFNINGNGDEYIMGKIAQAAPKIADATKKSILDERRRGGVYKSVFG